jgi:hypothetical protein
MTVLVVGCVIAFIVGLNLLLSLQFWLGYRQVRRQERELVPARATQFGPRQGRHFRPEPIDVYESVAS